MEAEFFLQSVSTVQPKIGAKLGNRENAEKLDLPLKMALLKRRAKVGKMTHSNYEWLEPDLPEKSGQRPVFRPLDSLPQAKLAQLAPRRHAGADHRVVGFADDRLGLPTMAAPLISQ